MEVDSVFSVADVMDVDSNIGAGLLVGRVPGRNGGRYIIDSTFLVSIREQYGCTAQLFAKIAGWGKANQSYLENPDEKKVNLKTLLKLYFTFGILEGIKHDTAYFLNRNNNGKDTKTAGKSN